MASDAPRGTIVLLHGHLDRKEDLLGAGKSFAAAGYRAVLVDLRSRGRSSGGYLTFGVQESRDAVQVLDALDALNLLAQPVGVFGRSYGGAVAIEWAAIDPRVRAVVSVSAFSSMRQAVHDAGARVVPGLVPWLLGWRLDAIVDRAGRRAHFDPDAVSPLQSISRTAAPVLLVHGSADRYIPPAHARRLHAAAPDHSELLFVPGKTHNSILDHDATPEVVRKSIEWFDRNLPPATR